MADEPASDGRQSERARDIARGATRCLAAHDFAALAEFPLANGRRADLLALADTGELWIVEIKSSLEDFRSDQKWPDYRDYCDRFFFAVMPDFPREVLPATAGLIIADRFDGELVRLAEPHRLSGARRKAVLTAFGKTAATRLTAHLDPTFARAPRG